MKQQLLIALVLSVIITSCTDRNGVIEAIFRLRDDSPLPSWFVLPTGMSRGQVSVTITDYEAATTPQWKVRFVVRDKKNSRVLQDVMGSGHWHPDSEREKAPAAIYPNWSIIEVNG